MSCRGTFVVSRRLLVPGPLPGRMLLAEPLRRRVRVRFGGAWIADSEDVMPLRVLVPKRRVGFRRALGIEVRAKRAPVLRGISHLVAFDFRTGIFAGPVVQLARLNGQALVLVR